MVMDLEKLRQKKARRGATGWAPKPGLNIIRILPPSRAALDPSTALDDFALEFRSHFLKAEGMDTRSYRCLRDAQKPCPFCEMSKRNKGHPDKALSDAAADLRSTDRHLMNILDLNARETGIQTYESGYKVWDAIMGYMANPNWGDLTDLRSGRNIDLTLLPQGTTKSGFNEYVPQPHPNPTDITPLLPPDYLERLDDLEAAIAAYPDDEIVEKWVGQLVRIGLTPPLGYQQQTAVAVTATPVVSAAAAPATPVTSTPALPTTTTQAPAPAAPSPVLTATVVDKPAAPAPTYNPSPNGADPKIVEFCNAHGLQVVSKPQVGQNAAPMCFSEGPSNKEIGFNPSKWPCEKGCPLRNPCQLKALGM